MRFKFSDSMLLKLALNELNYTKQQYQIRLYNKLKLKHSNYITTVKVPTNKKYNNETVYGVEKIYDTPVAFIKTTQYMRIKDIEYKKQKPAFKKVRINK